MFAFRIDLSMRYTRISCRPFEARYLVTEVVQARDEQDAQRQACLCLDRDLEEILSRVNSINVSELMIEFTCVQKIEARKNEAYWNTEWSDENQPVPPYFIIR